MGHVVIEAYIEIAVRIAVIKYLVTVANSEAQGRKKVLVAKILMKTRNIGFACPRPQVW